MDRIIRKIDVDLSLQGNIVKDFCIEARSADPSDMYNLGSLYFNTVDRELRYYDGTRWTPAAKLAEDGKVPIDELPIYDPTEEPSDKSVPTSKQMADAFHAIEQRLDEEITRLDSKIDTVESTLNERIDNLKIEVELDLEKKLDKEAVKTSWNELSDETVPSIQLTADRFQNLESKEGDDVDTLNARIDTEVEQLDAKIDKKVDKTDVINDWSLSAPDKIASAQLVKVALANKTDITMAVPVWSQTTSYQMNSSVVYAESIYISLMNNNIGHDPVESGDWWVQISGSGGGGGGGGGLKRKSIQFGNDTDTEYVLTHNLGSYDFLWSIRTNDEERRYVLADIYATSNTTCKVKLAEPPGTNALIINLMDIGASSSGTDVEIVSVTTESTTWTYDNTTNTAVFVQTFSYDEESGYYDEIRGNVEQESSTGFTPVIDTFGVPKAGEMLIAKTALIKEFTNSASWIFNHDLSEYVAVQCYKDGYGLAMGDINQDGNTVVVNWSKPESGFMILVEPSMVVDVNNERSKVIQHNLGRIVGLQMYTDEYGQVAADFHQNGSSTAMMEVNAPLTGKIIVI